MKKKSLFQFSVLALLLVAGSLSIAELVLWNNAHDSYPHSLVSSTPVNTYDLTSLRLTCGEPLDIKQDGPDTALVRCGMFWPMRSIWLVPKVQVAPVFSQRRTGNV